jgi:hypothetical protein
MTAFQRRRVIIRPAADGCTRLSGRCTALCSSVMAPGPEITLGPDQFYGCIRQVGNPRHQTDAQPSLLLPDA